jgi:hypothetical protein
MYLSQFWLHPVIQFHLSISCSWGFVSANQVRQGSNDYLASSQQSDRIRNWAETDKKTCHLCFLIPNKRQRSQIRRRTQATNDSRCSSKRQSLIKVQHHKIFISCHHKVSPTFTVRTLTSAIHVQAAAHRATVKHTVCISLSLHQL